MANITQTIPALTAGISQQPDEQKIPGQVNNMVNALPDVTQGLLKRPAGKFVASLSDGTNNSTANGKWFHYYRDENEQYIGQISRNGVIKMWDCLTGTEKSVVINTANATQSRSATFTRSANEITITLNNHGYTLGKVVDLDFASGGWTAGATDGVYAITGVPDANTFKVQDTASGTITTSNVTVEDNYLMHLDDEDIQTLTLNDFTYISNRKVDVEMSNTVFEPAGDFGKEVFVELKSISYAKQYALNLFDDTTLSTVKTATRISVEMLKSSNNYCDGSGDMVAKDSRMGMSTRCDKSAGNSRDSFAPNVGTRIFNISDGDSISDTGAVYSDAASTISVKNANGTAVNRGENLYFRVATTGQSVPFTETQSDSENDNQKYTETTYQARYTTTYDLLHGGKGWQVGDNFRFFMKNAIYKCTIEEISTSRVQANLGLIRPSPTPFDNETTITAESILGSIREQIVGHGSNVTGNGFTVTQIGNGLHIKRSTDFNGSTPVGELLNVVAGKVNDVGDLPSQCKNGMVVEVVNSEAEQDNYFVKFFGNNNKNGEGTWEECAQPGRKIQFTRKSMPHVLIRAADGNFRFGKLNGDNYTISGTTYSFPQWDNALCGDDVTNPEPSFVGKNINKMLFFRNRFCLLSDENIVMSRPGDFTNFWAKSAIQLVASDPIDISASSEYPAILYDGIQTNTGLILFSKNQQFMLTTDSDVFSPMTAKINALSTYNFNFKTNPISLGTTVGFLDNAGKFSRFFEMAQVQREGEPQVIEQSAVVPKLFEKDLKLISNSRENSIVFFSEEDTSTLYGYRYFDQIQERKLASWFKWTLTGVIQYHCMQDDSLFVVLRNNNKDQLIKYSLKQGSDDFALNSEKLIHLDHLMSTSGWTYNSTTGKSTKAKPTGLESSNQLAAYDVDDSNTPQTAIGRYGLITINGSNLEIDGDWSGQTFLIGYQFTMQVDLPTIYYVRQIGQAFRSDTRAHTILHRVKLGFGPVGLYETTLSRVGKKSYTQIFETTDANIYLANTGTNVEDNKLRTIPIYDRNTNTSLTIKSTHPLPATIHYLTWEGVYSNNNYERV